MQEDLPVRSFVSPVYSRRVAWSFALILLLWPFAVRAHDPDDPRGFFPKALVLGAAGKFDEAGEYIMKAPGGAEKDTLDIARRLLSGIADNRIHPQAATMFFHGLKAMREGRNEEASREFAGAAGISPDYADTYRLLGAIAAAAGRHEEAAGWLRTLAGLVPSDGSVYQALGASYYAMGQPLIAAGFYEKAIANGVYSAGVFTGLGDAYVASGQAVEAQKNYQQALERDPGNGGAYLGIGLSYLLMGDVTGARRSFALARKMCQARGEWEAAAKAQGYLDEAAR